MNTEYLKTIEMNSFTEHFYTFFQNFTTQSWIAKIKSRRFPLKFCLQILVLKEKKIGLFKNHLPNDICNKAFALSLVNESSFFDKR